MSNEPHLAGVYYPSYLVRLKKGGFSSGINP